MDASTSSGIIEAGFAIAPALKLLSFKFKFLVASEH
jgi:hypothetical protein